MKKSKKLKMAFLLMSGMATLVLLYGYKEYNRKNPSLHEVKASFTMQPKEIISKFSEDEKKATLGYAGKVVLLSGNVKSVDKDDKGFYTVVLGDENSMSSVRCSIDSIDTKNAVAIQPSTSVKIKGICTGYMADEMGLGSDVILNRCVIENR